MRSRGWLFLALAVVFIAAPLVFAQTASDSSTPLLLPCDEPNPSGTPGIRQGSDCTIAHFFNQFIVLAQWGLTLAVSLGLLMIIYGGFQWITAAGRSSKIEDGKRIVLGTIVGIGVSFTAYIIINFSIAAITGTTAPSQNPFSGPIATIFGGSRDERPFSGTGTPINQVTDCNSRWNIDCDDKIYCADASTESGRVHDIQALLNAKNCVCGKPDGCYGAQTAECVRKFQIANDLPPTGEIDFTTETLLNGSGDFCDASTLITQRVTSVNQQLPKPSVISAQAGSATLKGCCVIGGSSQPLFCANDISQRTCFSLGTGNRFLEDTKCEDGIETRTICGFCHDSNGKCFGQATKYWCENRVTPTQSMTFVTGDGRRSPLCPNFIPSLRTVAP